MEHLIQPLHRDGKLSLDQALVKQCWERVSSRVSCFPLDVCVSAKLCFTVFHMVLLHQGLFPLAEAGKG